MLSTTGASATWQKVWRACASEQAEGASPLFPPAHQEQARAKDELLHLVHRDPHELGHHRSRWRLCDLLTHLSAWNVRTSAGVQRILRRMDIHYKRGRSYIHSPDKCYVEKMERIEQIKLRVQGSHGREMLVYLDECSIRRQPSVGYTWEEAGSDAPHAHWKPRYDTVTRIIGALNPASGRVIWTTIGKVTTQALVSFYRKLRAAYPTAERLWVVQDNWPMHLHPDVLTALEPQEKIYPVEFSHAWRHQREPSPSGQRRKPPEPLPIQIVQLPTYARLVQSH